MTVKVAVISDTHTRGESRPVPPGAWPYLESADHIFHAGDVCDPGLLDELSALAPLTVVMGNCDAWDVKEWRDGVPDEIQTEVAGVPIAMLHDSGPRARRRERMRARFPDARVVIFGHSHLPVAEDDGTLLLLNPGSATWKRTAPFTSMAMLWITDGAIETDLIPV